MATSRINRCHICDKILTKDDTVVDDIPFGVMCVQCEDSIYGNWMDIQDEYPLEEH